MEGENIYMSKVLWISHFDAHGSGYQSISVELCNRLVDMGHQVKALGFEYRGEPQDYNFSLIPAADFSAIFAEVHNIRDLWSPDIAIVAFDVPMHKFMLARQVFTGLKYIGIFPLESDPLILPYAMLLSMMDAACVISRFGTEECKKFGVQAHYLEVGIDLEKWRQPSAIERDESRTSLGVADTFNVLTVADNQERKNLSRALEIFADFHKTYPKSKYMLVTREKLSVGWDLRDYARVLGIGDSFSLFERGMDFPALWAIYAAADAFLLTSKAEGAAMPLLEAMAIGIPCVGTDCTAIHEHLADGRGYLIPPEYSEYVDPFMNGRRYFISRIDGAIALKRIAENDPELPSIREKAFKYIEGRNWEGSVQMLDSLIKEIGGTREPQTK
jgi:glycosyltransferase involved in cell wall biosynthesis